jgi:hypothetical protein
MWRWRSSSGQVSTHKKVIAYSQVVRCYPQVHACLGYLGALSTLLRHAALPSLSAHLGSFRDWKRRWHVVVTLQLLPTPKFVYALYLILTISIC